MPIIQLNYIMKEIPRIFFPLWLTQKRQKKEGKKKENTINTVSASLNYIKIPDHLAISDKI